jgi:hypothetical protein
MMVSRLGRWWNRHGVLIRISLVVSKPVIPDEEGEQFVVDQPIRTRDESGLTPEMFASDRQERKQREKREMYRVLDEVNLSLAILRRDAELMTSGRTGHD